MIRMKRDKLHKCIKMKYTGTIIIKNVVKIVYNDTSQCLWHEMGIKFCCSSSSCQQSSFPIHMINKSIAQELTIPSHSDDLYNGTSCS